MFEANIHSKWQIGWKDVSMQCFAQVSEVLLQNYRSSVDIVGVWQVDEWEQTSNNYRVRCDSDGEAHEVLVRRHILQGPDEIHAASAVIRHLCRYAVLTPALIFADNGRNFVQHHGQQWQVFEFVPGDHFRGEEDELVLATALIARMHHAFDVFPDKRYIGGIDVIVGPLDTAFWRNATSRLAGANAFEQFVFERQEIIGEITVRISHFLPASPAGMIHGDLHPQNFLFPEKRKCVILDFGNMCMADQMYDIAMALHRLVRQYAVHQGRPWEKTLSEGINIFLEAYPASRLIDREVKLLPVFMKGLLLRKMAHNFNLYRAGKRTWESCLSQWQRFFGFIEEADAIQAVLT